MKYSLDKIAAELGIAKTTVSLILNGKARQYAISKALEERVKDFCKSKNYVINIHAKRMRQRLAGNIGLLLPSGSEIGLSNPFADYNITEIIGGISTCAFNRGFRFSIQLYDSGLSADQVFDWVNSREVDGVVLYGYANREFFNAAAKEKFPLVAIGEDPGIGIPTVSVDDRSGSRQVAEHLIAKGHKNLLYIGGSKVSYVSDERLKGFSDAMSVHNLRFDPGTVRYCRFSESETYGQVKGLLASGRMDATAIVCSSDMMAIGAIRALKEAGLRVPEDVAVAGGDDISLARYFSPSITTFPRRLMELGELAFTLVYDIIDAKRDYDTHLKLDTTLEVRQST